MSVPRRRFLETLAATGTVGAAAGCLFDAESASNRTPSDTATRTDTRTTTDPGPQTLPERDLFNGTPCPSFTETDRTVCWHTHNDGHEVAIKPSQQLFQPVSGNDTVETITFTLTNTQDAPILFNPYSWAIKRKTDDAWVHIAPDDVAYKPLYELDPGNSYEWVVSRQQHPHPQNTRAVYPTVDFENGRHAFVLTGSLADRTPNQTETTDERAGTNIEWVALFEVQHIHE